MKKATSLDHNMIIRETTNLLNLNLSVLIGYIENHLKSFYHTRTVKSSLLNFTNTKICSQDKLLSEWKQDFLNLVKNTTTLRFSPFQKLAFRCIKSLTKYDCLAKRDGSILNIVRDEAGTLITDSALVSKIIIDYMRNIDRRHKRIHINWGEIPSLPPPTNEEILAMISRISVHKALTTFPVPDELITYISDNHLTGILTELWEPQFLSRFPQIFECRLIPLNKTHPQIGGADKMRPIVCTNVLFKLLESRFTDELHLKFWELKGYALSQFGFLRNLSTQTQICNLLNQTTSNWIKDPNLKTYKHISFWNPQLPKYNPEENYLIFIDYCQAFNSINLTLLFEKMRYDKILEEDKLIYLFTLYSQLKIKLGNECYTPRNGVPQGGVNSPLLFNFAIYYCLTEAALTINKRIQLQEGRPHLPRTMQPEDNFLWADDLATLLRVHPRRALSWIKIYFEVMIEVGLKWGLTINFSKSAVMHMFSQRTSYRYLSDHPTIWTSDKGTELTLNITVNNILNTIKIPLVTSYKYLGVRISRNLTPKAHFAELKKKINYLVNAFKAVRGTSQNLKFCHNTWQLFVRPLLDYSLTYFSYLEEKHLVGLHALYRQSLRKMLFLKNYVPIDVIDSLIQYDYRNLHLKFRELTNKKVICRMACDVNNTDLKLKVDFSYQKVELQQLPWIWSKVWNLLSIKGKECKVAHHNHPISFTLSIYHILSTLAEYKLYDVKELLYKFLVSPIDADDLHKLEQIYKVLLSIF